jgi:hypothetical protein
MIRHGINRYCKFYGEYSHVDAHGDIWLHDITCMYYAGATTQQVDGHFPPHDEVQMDHPEPVVYDGPPPQAAWRWLNTSTLEDLSA